MGSVVKIVALCSISIVFKVPQRMPLSNPIVTKFNQIHHITVWHINHGV